MRTHARTYSAAAKLRASKMSDKTVAPFAGESFMYACKVKETTNGCRRGARGETRQALEVIVERRFARDVQIDEQSGAAENGEDQAQRETHAKTREKIAPSNCLSGYLRDGEEFLTMNLSFFGSVAISSGESPRFCAIKPSGVPASSSEIPIA